MKNIEKFSEIQDHSAIYHLPHNDEHDLLIEIDNIQENNNRNFVQSNGEVPKEITNLLRWKIKYAISVLMKVKNLMIFCSVRSVISKNISENSSTHKYCYGSELIDGYDKINWQCEKCVYIKQNPMKKEKLKCIFCPFKVGIIKKISEDEWAHIVCVNWDENIHYLNERKERINYQDINKEKYSLKCMFCNIHEGACIQCDIPSCYRSFHVICAIQKGVIKHWKLMELNKENHSDKINIYCKFHEKSKKKVKQLNKNQSIETARKTLEIKGKSIKNIAKFNVKMNEKGFKNEKMIESRLKNSDNDVIDLTDSINHSKDDKIASCCNEKTVEKFKIKPNLGRILGIYYPITLDDLFKQFKKYLKTNKLIDKKEEYIYINKSEKLKDLFKCDMLTFDLGTQKLKNFVEKIEKIELNKSRVVNKESKEIKIIENVSDINNKNECEKLKRIKNINSIYIHSSDFILKRNFFIKENALKLFKF